MVDDFTREYVLAQWAYSELNSLEQGEHYVGVDGLKAKEAQRVPFTDLTKEEHALLLKKWHEYRGFGTIFSVALAGVQKFQLQHWTKAQLGGAYIISHFFRWLGPECAFGETRFKDWIEAEPHGELYEHHPLRTTSLAWRPQEAPATVARVRLLLVLGTQTTGLERFMLLDGYHRAACFWNTADPNSTLAVYVPIAPGPS
jgi:hypothetical protein